MSRGLIRDTVTDSNGNSLSGILVNVYQPGTTTKATLYDASTGGAVVTNPLTTSSLGVFEAFADTGEYDLVIEAPNGDITVPNLSVLDADDINSLGSRLTAAESDIDTLQATSGSAASAAASASAASDSADSAASSASSAEAFAAILEDELLRQIQTTYTGLDIVAACPIVPGDWRKQIHASYMDEDRPSGSFIGFYSSDAAFEAAGGQIGDWYWNLAASIGRQRTGTSTYLNIRRAGSDELPALAVAVATTSKVIIFDCTKNEPEMWMEFVAATDNLLGGTGAAITSVAFGGSQLHVGKSNGAGGGSLITVDLAEDSGAAANSTARYTYLGSIAARNGALGLSAGDTALRIVNSAVNSVATYLDTAEGTLNDAGVQIPYVLVGTDGGVSQIDPDGSVWDLTANGPGNRTITAVAFNEAGPDFYFTAHENTATTRFVNRHSGLLTADQAGTTHYTDVAGVTRISEAGTVVEAAPGYTPESTGDADHLAGTSANNEFYIGHTGALTAYLFNESAPLESLGAYIRAASTTGWMKGDVQAAWLGTTATETVGDERISNGDFASDTVWVDESTGTGTSVISGGVLTLTSGTPNGTNRGIRRQTLTLEVGKTYELQVDQVSGSGARLDVTTDLAPVTLSAGTNRLYFTATATERNLKLYSPLVDGGSAGVDNVRVRETLVNDGTFDTDVAQSTGTVPVAGTYWTLQGNDATTVEITGGSLVMILDANSFAAAYHNDDILEVGKAYRYSLTASIDAGTTTLEARNTGGNLLHFGQAITTTPTTYEGFFTAVDVSLRIQRPADGSAAGDTITITDFSVVEVLPDYSGNGNHLNIIGELDYAPVATGAELAALSGFSATDYAETAAGADGITTGDFCFSGWVNGVSNNVNFQTMFDRGVAGPSTRIRVDRVESDAGSNANEWRTLVGASGAQFSGDTSSGLVYVVFQRTAGTAELYINGSLVDSYANATDLTEAGAVVDVGVDVGHNNPMVAGISLFRFSNTPMTAADISRVYRDELKLFQENAACTLSGGSDAVTSLAYDTKRNRVHAATSGGVSVFSGLNRVDSYTGDGAVAAHDDLVVRSNGTDTAIDKPAVSLRTMLAELRG